MSGICLFFWKNMDFYAYNPSVKTCGFATSPYTGEASVSCIFIEKCTFLTRSKKHRTSSGVFFACQPVKEPGFAGGLDYYMRSFLRFSQFSMLHMFQIL